MNELNVFRNEEFGEVREATIDNKEYFCGSDIAKALGYKDANDAISRHCRCTVKHLVPHPQNKEKTFEMVFIPESDIYRLIIKSKLPSAEKFEKWVFEEVLPSIRKHGAYMTNETLEKTISNPDFLMGLLQNLKQEQQARQIAESKLEEVKPKVEYHDVVLNNENFFPITNIAKDLGMTANKLNTYLSDLHIQYRRSRNWILYREYDWLTTNGYADYKESQFGNQLQWSSKGKQFIIKLLGESKYVNLLPKDYTALSLQNVVSVEV